MRTYGESIEVRTADPAAVLVVPVAQDSSGSQSPPAPPVQFLWRGRLYLVREVLAHWVELGTWWAVRAPRTSSVAAGARTAEDRSATPGSEAGPGPGPRSVSADVGAVEREVWRVEAASGRTARIGVYDLVRDVPATASSSSAPDRPPRWRLARALD